MIKGENIFYALIGDLVASRAMTTEQRREVQERFQNTLNKINSEFSGQISAKFLITAGDETQGLLYRRECLYDVIRKIQIELWPAEIVFGVGCGTLTTDIGEYAVGGDGPAFHLARQALIMAKKERKEYGKAVVREVRIATDKPESDNILNSLLLALAVIKNHWTEKQTQILHHLEAKTSVSKVAEKLGIAKSSVSRAIDKTHFREFEQIADSIRRFLQ